MMPLLTVRGLKVSIRTDEGIAQVLDDVGLDLERGRILGVVGESGCGKSTLGGFRRRARCEAAASPG